MHFEKLQQLISQKNLPGEKAHAPYLKYRRIFEDSKKEQARSAAVGIHIFEKEKQLFFYLIERSTYDGQHSGQMAFPGGKQDPLDPHLECTARRESEEELGIKQQHGTTLKQLTEVWIPVSGFVVTPFVIVHHQEPDLQINYREVAHVEVIKILDLLDEQNIQNRDILLPNNQWLKEHPCFILNERIVWGATALMLNELRLLLQEF
jgi:8-oxo-dGTP pyrophosphatase MutT (NUDIX family)